MKRSLSLILFLLLAAVLFWGCGRPATDVDPENIDEGTTNQDNPGGSQTRTWQAARHLGSLCW